jgi:hypothetical protein
VCEQAARRWSAVALLFGLAALAVWRAACVKAGPDLDSDAYAHHMIARAILADPRDLSVHWVWLPLFHYAQVPFVALGFSMQAVRWANLVVSAALPVVVYRYVARTAGASVLPPAATALVAALLAAGCPIAMQMGTTAQPEPLFALLVLAFAIAFEERRTTAAAALLGAAAMVRYEAWAVLVGAAAVLAAKFAGRGTRAGPPTARAREWPIVALPAALILLWAVLRRPVDGRWFGFVRDTHEFASDALTQQGLARGPGGVLLDALRYPVEVPWRVEGPALLLLPLGIARTVRQQGRRFVLVFVACLGFVSLSWVMRSTLGLDRHFVCIVPLYAVAGAQGIAVLADAVHRGAGRAFGRRQAHSAMVAARVAAGGTAVAALVGLGLQLEVWMGYWRASIVRGWPDRAALAATLRTLPGDPKVFCDEATIEILSGLDRRRFDRHWIEDPHTWELIGAAARQTGSVYVATWRRKLQGHEGKDGEIVFRAGFDPGDPDATGVALMRVPADARDSAR